jgi:hypothetical protein
MKTILTILLILAAIVPAYAQSTPTPPNPPVSYHPAQPEVFGFVYGAMILVLAAGIFGLTRVLKRDKDWSLADAMSEADGKPSTSRLIAFLGMLVMASIIFGLGCSSLWVFLETGQVPALAGVTPFLIACAGLFTPYLANQVGQAFSSQPAPSALAPVVTQTANSSFQLGASALPTVTFGSPVKPGSV